jgi:hypothetical protein
MMRRRQRERCRRAVSEVRQAEGIERRGVGKGLDAEGYVIAVDCVFERLVDELRGGEGRVTEEELACNF